MENDVPPQERDAPDLTTKGALPKWQPDQHQNYDGALHAACSAELSNLLAAPEEERGAFLKDLRDLHQTLYALLSPDDYPEYAGTYRGTKGTTLEHRRVGAEMEEADAHGRDRHATSSPKFTIRGVNEGVCRRVIGSLLSAHLS
jgi:hypothetical protein